MMPSVRAAAVQAFRDIHKITGSVLVTYRRLPAGTHSVTTGTSTRVPVDAPGIPVILKEYDRHELLALQIEPENRRALLCSEDLGAIVPTIGDQLITADAVALRIENTRPDEVGAVWDCQVRRPQ